MKTPLLPVAMEIFVACQDCRSVYEMSFIDALLDIQGLAL